MIGFAKSPNFAKWSMLILSICQYEELSSVMLNVDRGGKGG